MVEEGPGEVHDSGASGPLQSPPRSRAPEAEADPGTPGPAAIVTSRAAGRGPRERSHPSPPRPGPLAGGGALPATAGGCGHSYLESLAG